MCSRSAFGMITHIPLCRHSSSTVRSCRLAKKGFKAFFTWFGHPFVLWSTLLTIRSLRMAF